jgi:hypothetical protein
MRPPFCLISKYSLVIRHISSLSVTFVIRHATHIAIWSNNEEDFSNINIRVLNRYLDLDPVGPVIDGTMVLQGSVPDTHGPAVCKVEFAADHDENFTEISRIMPWEMIFNPGDGDDNPATFAIPISLGVEQQDGTLRIVVLVEETHKIPYGGETASFSAESSHLIPAILLMTRIGADSSSFEAGMAVSDDVVVTVCVARGLEEKEQWESEGYQTNPVSITADGVLLAETAGWPFFICSASTTFLPGMECLEDIIFVQTESRGAAPTLPAGYEVISDLTQPDAAVRYPLSLLRA